MTSWLGIMVPSGTPADIRARIAAPLATFVQEPAIIQRLQELGAVAAKINTPQEFDAWIRRDYDKWAARGAGDGHQDWKVSRREVLRSSCPRLSQASTSYCRISKTWMAGTSPAMTAEGLVLPAGFEPAISGVRFRHPWPLDDGSVSVCAPSIYYAR